LNKDEIRKRIWHVMEEAGVTLPPRPVKGRIPNFRGAEKAALHVTNLREWRRAEVVKANPDSPQRWLREAALVDGKKVVMATPRLRKGFVVLDPSKIAASMYRYASTIKGAFKLGRQLDLNELERIGTIDFMITGSVAVDRRGRRIGKGEGYAEIEYAILRELGLVGERTPVATTIHELQLVDELPHDPYDISVDYAATPQRLIHFTGRDPRPKGIIWSLLPCSKLREIPLLSLLAKMRGIDAASICRRGLR